MLENLNKHMQNVIRNCLDHFAYHDAIFLAELLLVEVDCEENVLLLATAYFYSGQIGKAYHLLHIRGSQTPKSKFLLAKCCYELNKINEAEAILNGGSILKFRTLDDLVHEFGGSAAFSMQLLAKICQQTERKDKASEFYRRSLKLNPFLWTSFEALCEIGEKIDPASVFRVSSNEHSKSNHSVDLNHLKSDSVSHNTPDQFVLNDSNWSDSKMISLPEPLNQPNSFSSNHLQPKFTQLRYKTIFEKHEQMNSFTPSLGILPLDTPSPLPMISSQSTYPNIMQVSSLLSVKKSARKDIVLQANKGENFGPFVNPTSTLCLMHPIPITPQPILTPQKVRRSSRLFASNNSVKENNKAPSKKFPPKVCCRKLKSRNRVSFGQTPYDEVSKKDALEVPKTGSTNDELSVIPNKAIGKYTLNQNSSHILVMNQIMEILCIIGSAFFNLAQYNCKRALELFGTLPVNHGNSLWVLSHLGRIHFELAEYKEASKFYQKLHEKAPYHLDGMEYYSTALWHLQKEVPLSVLAQNLVDYNRLAPQTWCAVGNCFSLQKEHETAIRFFQRAIQVASHFTYAHTLLGHEYVCTEELEKAMNCFRTAIRLDPRHYNAWYGIGMIYFKQERYSLAEIYYKRALSIYPLSTALMCHVGVVQYQQQKMEEALATLNHALSLQPNNLLCQFHHASIAFHCEKYEDALKELYQLQQSVPRESLIYFLMGKVHKKLGNTHLALMNFSWAMDLDPKGANNYIKEGIDPALNRFGADDDGGSNLRESDIGNTDDNMDSQVIDSQESIQIPRYSENDESA